MSSFEDWHADYAKLGIDLFPVNFDPLDPKRKFPAVKRWQTMTPKRSADLVKRMGDHRAYGFCLGPPSGITVLDIDSKDERHLADALSKHGDTPYKVKTPGGYHAYYKFDGEKRLIKPLANTDILGGGYVVAAASSGPRGWWLPIDGSHLDDIPDVPLMRDAEAFKGFAEPIVAGPDEITPSLDEAIRKGERNDKLFRYCLRVARGCADFDELLAWAEEFNAMCVPPMIASEVVKTARSAWGKEISGNNWCGSRGVVPIPQDLIRQFTPDAFWLYADLCRAHAGLREEFTIALEAYARSINWTKPRLIKARDELLGRLIERIYKGGGFKGDTALYRFLAQTASAPRGTISYLYTN
jgi:hypothetical protein